MADPFLDNIEKSLENGDVPQRVTNRMVLAALRGMDEKMDKATAAGANRDERLTLLEHWQSRANGAIKAAMALGGTGLLITILKIVGIL